MILGLEFPLTSEEIHAVAAKPSIDPVRLLEEQLEFASPDLLRSLLSTIIQALMSADVDAVCGAPFGTSSPDRVTRRNGYRHRDFDTRAGTIGHAESRMRGNTHVRFGERPGETDREKSRHRAPGRLNNERLNREIRRRSDVVGIFPRPRRLDPPGRRGPGRTTR